MGLLSRLYNFISGGTIRSSEVNAELNQILNLSNGNLGQNNLADNCGAIEIMADVEHKRWSSWQEYLHSLSTKNKDGSLTISKQRVEYWEKLISTNYDDLSEKLKDKDRMEAETTIVTLKEKGFIIIKTCPQCI